MWENGTGGTSSGDEIESVGGDRARGAGKRPGIGPTCCDSDDEMGGSLELRAEGKGQEDGGRKTDGGRGSPLELGQAPGMPGIAWAMTGRPAHHGSTQPSSGQPGAPEPCAMSARVSLERTGSRAEGQQGRAREARAIQAPPCAQS
ncbi:hypothetical protein A1Q1_04992 [Trichosporon asahii var. asahii CBS 2479]|uniref:Uncharacterized protein n=1 Tax=Trichosporon asahii var. asahii (strain ATCC 90039 / CBS 2479 / JCM 2466 / KCTC 7840 / NBRC 103889/ NCYC 2677 / UAMH 7654) TaxID=1186058 RepID=J4U7M7_TRIAS|nr:hypothetical protein A1Q1_04992 [Trichosporon asahii var. asahii CBS 2479]EJT46345.1 hypothetical protein A1Q1_04992 [Trichosporon asahii var. asahii CBS 2479]